ncbi:hypothetical protein [Lentilitoribacter sp. Alg239-R112]|uniref:hypothetical protein n=1 Tax=Lentilitoribacter sp. Alg239-R112 TaxID=2305987 RepID=UPI0013A6A062|nr:hypothetical protein [Lentilitoribacter sp. Alg239-R112]
MAETERTSPMVRVILILFLLTPLLIGVGFTYLSYVHFQRVYAQFQTDRVGVEVAVKIEFLEIEEHIFHGRIGNLQESNRLKPTYFCNIEVSYSSENNERYKSKIRLEDEKICELNEMKGIIIGRYLPDDPNVFILNEGRLSVWRLALTIVLACIFLVIPLSLLIRGALRFIRVECWQQ